MHPNGYTKEMIKEILGTSWPTLGDRETGNELRKRIGREIREGKRQENKGLLKNCYLKY